jgi:hypothetical protein
LIAQATFRLEPLTEVFCGVWLPCADPEHAARLVGIVSDDQIAPTGIDLRWHAGGLFGLIVMIEDNRDDVQARAERLHGLAGRHCLPTIAMRERPGPVNPVTAGSRRALCRKYALASRAFPQMMGHWYAFCSRLRSWPGH